MKTNLSHSLCILLSLLLAACGPLALTPTVTPSATSVPSSTPTITPYAMSTPTPIVTQTLYPPFEYQVSFGDTCESIAANFKVSVEEIIEKNNTRCDLTPGQTLFIPHSTVPQNAASPTPYFQGESILREWQAQVALATPIRTPVIREKLEKYPSVYAEKGNLFFRSNKESVTQLTATGQDHGPILSEDGQKIAFYRGDSSNDLYSINSDGSQEQAIVTNKAPLVGEEGEIDALTFVPNAHILLFNIYHCEPKKGLYDYPDCSIGLYSGNADTGSIHPIIENIKGNRAFGRNFEISPDGKHVSTAGEGHINIYSLSSGNFELAFPDIDTYFITPDDEYLPSQYWLPNSSGLIIIQAADGESNEPATPPANYLALRYTIGNTQATLMPLDKHIVREDGFFGWLISPDRNWMLFTGSDDGYYGSDSHFHYLANLNNGHTQAYEPAGQAGVDLSAWSSDSQHFTYSGLIGSVDGSLPVPVGGIFIEWIDATHYYYSVDENETYIGEVSGN